MQETYADLEIRILEERAGGYPVEMTLNHEREFEPGYLDPAFLPWVPSASPGEDGQKLFDWLFADDRLKVAWAEVRGSSPRRRVRLRIDAAAPDLHDLPWELLRDAAEGRPPQDLAAATATPFSRYLAGRWRPGSPILKRPIRVLVAVASPGNLGEYGLEAIDPEAEWALLQAATEGLDVEPVRLPQSCTLAALREALQAGYHVLHLVAHGAYNEEAGKAVLFLADGENQVERVADADFASMLANELADAQVQNEDKLRLVFLASCQTATRSPADAFRGFAPALVKAGVPAVVAMQDLVPVETAREFAGRFYRQLLEHGQADLAGNQARASLLAGGLPGAACPVLFMRLRSGALLGRRGRITSKQGEQFWPFLLGNISLGRCTAFLGPRVNAGLLPSAGAVAEKLADKYGYPLPDRRNLVRVAQFMAISDPDLLRDEYLRLLQRALFRYLDVKPTEEEKRRFRNASFTETAEALDWAVRALVVQENEVHHLLAGLELPLYVTTNADNFMVEALKHRGLSPRREGPRWQPQAGTPQYVLSPPPSADRPVVFHLNGHDGDPEQRRHLVLSEDDYLAHFVRISRDQDSILPMNLLRLISEHSFLFLGYDIDDWEFRVILQGLVGRIAQTGERKVHVGVQLEVDQERDADQERETDQERNAEQERETERERDAKQERKADKVRNYLQRYLGRFDIDIYWGTPRQFASELHARWQEYLEAEEDDWD